ncbi:hypothetical protein HRI_004696300 [Hibiscus trionum]|uniref:Uncharacterized protein n=1 Tax=Hibiscus trionum TaxID=183268 RepID=A0A9W7MUX6_HIBTR|nr:hypothetical protein HRI_004696300 [Hibiscus trionum]
MSKKTNLKVTVADGNSIETVGECPKVVWRYLGEEFQSDFLVVPLKCCDVVLVIQWLVSLGPINWDFSSLQMSWNYRGRRIELKGLQPGVSNVVDARKCNKMLRSNHSPFTASLLIMGGQLELKKEGQTVPENLAELLEEFDDVFREPTGLPPIRGQVHRVNLLDDQQIVKVKPYRYPASQKDEIEKQVREMIETGIIRYINSSFSSPIVMVKKKDGSWRLCVDYKRLNQLTVKDKFPMPIIEELLDELGKAKSFSKLDLRAGYHQIKMWESDVHKTAFKTHEGHYEFLVIPFGLTNAPATFQSLMNRVFRNFLRKSVLVFFDDILVYSNNWESHKEHLREVLTVLREQHLFAKKNKCCFGATEVDYLGYVISGVVIAMDKSKVDCIMSWPTPKHIKDLRGFLGISGYYRRFVRDYGTLARHLTNLLKKGGWKWGTEEDVAFDELKRAVSNAHVLTLPDFSVEFSVETDASDLGVGAVLTQRGKPIAFFSRGLGVRHQGLSVYKKEMLAVLMAVKKWSAYLVGRHFKIKTDHQSLKFLTENQAVTPAQQKWVVKMLGYDYEVVYRKGNTNIVADALSRKPVNEGVELMAISSVDTGVMARVKNSWSNDDKLQKIITDLQGGSLKHHKYSWDEEILRRKGKILVGQDESLRKDLMNYFHCSPIGGHSGADVTVRRLSSIFFWKGLRKNVKSLVRECGVCQRNKGDLSHPRGLLQPLPIPDKVWTSISMDFVEGLPKSRGNDVILVVVDRLSKYGHFIPLSHPYTAKDVARIFLENIFKLHGMPSTIVCDRDRVFMSYFWKELFLRLGTVITPSTAYHPETEDQTERVNQCLETYLRCMSGEKPKEWSDWLHLAEWWYNSSYHASIKTSPYQALYGQEPAAHIPYLAGESVVAAVDRGLQQREAALKMLKFHLKRAQDRMKQQADKKRLNCVFEVEDMVFLKLQPYRQQSVHHRSSQKLAPKWFGPYKVAERIGAIAYKLELPSESRIHPVFHVSQLKKQVGSDEVHSQLPLIGPDGGISKEPIKILDRRVGRRGNKTVTEVLVEWSNTFPEDAAWESLYQLQQQFPEFNP